MADHSAGDGVEDVIVEEQIELQLEEQRESLSAVEEALASDPDNPELTAVLEELQIAIKDAEEGLLHLKRSRLLRETDLIFGGQEPEPLNSKLCMPEETYFVGSKCRFRHSDGRWYNGHIVAFEGPAAARISFLTPTSESMLMCKFFLKQRCRFGNNCRMSHGFCIPISSLKPYIPTAWSQTLVGSTIWAISGGHSSIWRRAEVEFWNDKLRMAQVVFQDDGSSARLGSEDLSVSAYADTPSDDDGGNDGDGGGDNGGIDESSGSSDEDGSVHRGVGFLEASVSQRGAQTETALFATWEHHTRGVASKMMASMGYCRGMGLGASGQGTVDPIPVRVLPSRQSLDRAVAAMIGKKRSRGGRRMQEKKRIAVEAAEAEEEEGADVFSFINSQLAGRNGGSKPEGAAKIEDRRSLVAYEDELKELRARVGKLEEMVGRNRRDKTVFEAASRKLIETRKALADAEAAHFSASVAVTSKEKEKRWLKF